MRRLTASRASRAVGVCLVFVGIYWLVNGADGQRERDSLFFLYSGHGGQQPDPHGVEARLVRRCVAATVPWSTLITPQSTPDITP